MRKLTVYTTKKENIAGFVYIIIQLLLLPTLLSFINEALASPFSPGALNFIFFAINFICVAVIFHRYLLASVRLIISNPFAILKAALLGFVVYQAGRLAIGIMILSLCPDFSNLNDSAIMDSIAQNYTLMSFGTILLAPIAEEVLYRGVVFGSIHKQSPAMAYIVSTVVFSLIHIIGYLHLYTPMALLCSFLLYLPAGLCLAWAYAKSGNIIAPILIHIAVNQLGILYMR